MLETMGIMLRFHGVFGQQESLEEELGCSIHWGRTSQDGFQSAQIDMTPEDEKIHWEAVIVAVRTIAQRVSALVDKGVIHSAKLDIGLPFYEGNMATSITIPASLCEIAGQNRIAVATTYYLTAREEVTTEDL